MRTPLPPGERYSTMEYLALSYTPMWSISRVTGLSTTSYALLGQIALRSRTSYELAAEMRRNVHYFWPRAESLVYAELKRLAGEGLVAAERSFVGKRPRTTYAITPAGRTALAAWLGTRPRPFALELEA